MLNRISVKTIVARMAALATIWLMSACAARTATPASSLAHTPTPSQKALESVPITPTPTAAIAPETLGNLRYRIPELAQSHPETGGEIPLQGGRYTSAGGELGVELLRSAIGDLNGDGTPDGAAILAVQSHNRALYYLTAALDVNGWLTPVASSLVGELIEIKAMRIADGEILLDFISRAPDETTCCLGRQTSAVYILRGGRLIPRGLEQALDMAQQAVEALRDGDMQRFAALAHPTLGVRFSPYAYVRSEDLVFSPQQLGGLMSNPTLYTWGAFDGSGEPIVMTYADYHARFVYSGDFAAADTVGFNQRIGLGNSLDNSREFYPNALIVEFYLAPREPQYGGMDWQSLRLALLYVDGAWRVVGVIHDEWTI